MKRNLLIIFFYCFSSLCVSQSSGTLTHFANDLKLRQSRILDIQQDQKGFIWLSTFNGLIRYDGSTFQKFRVKQNSALNLISNRVFKFKFDKSGRIWIQSEKNDIYYFDTRQLSFHYPIENGALKSSNIAFVDFKVMPSGRVWLFPEDKNYLIAFEANKKVRKIAFDPTKKCGKIHNVFEDALGTTWFFTDGGICRLNKGSSEPQHFFFNGKSYLFESYMETKEDLWFGGNEGKFTRYNKKSSTFFDFELGIKENIIQTELVGHNKVLIITSGQNFYFYDIKTGKLTVYNSGNLAGFPNKKFNYLGSTRARQFWFEILGSGVYQFDLFTGKIKLMKIDYSDSATGGGERKSFLLTSPNGTVWIQSNNAPFSYWDEKQDKLCSIIRCINESKESVSDLMHTAMFDRLGNLWFCSFKQGLDLVNFSNSNFSALNLDSSGDHHKHNVRSLMKDNKGNLWVGSRKEKIALFDSQKRKIGFLGADGTLSQTGPAWGADIYSMLQDTKGRVWIGTRGNGLFCLLPTDQPFRYKVTNYKYDEKDNYSLNSNDIFKIFQASNGQIYIATWGGGVNIIRESHNGLRFINFKNELKNYPIKTADKVRSIVENKDHKIFFISSYKLFSFAEGNKTTSKIKFNEYSQVSGNDILDILITHDNQMALATNGMGLILADLDQKGKLNVKSIWNEMVSFPVEGVVAIQEDKKGKIWLMSDNQMVRFDPKNNSAETFPELKSIIGTEIFSEATKCELANGEIAVGYSNGVICFKPEAIKPFNFKPYLAISGFLVNNKELHELNPETPKNPDLLEEVTLEHHQNFFRVQISALDYLKSENIVYRYKLEGIDKQWNFIKGGQSINYTNLGRGNYTLLASSTNGHNLWMDNERQIKITIRPSVWGTNLAYFCYLLLAAGLFLLIKRAIITIVKLRNDVRLEKQMGELKLKFFTDISHEIRTPLTMIAAPLEVMLSDDEIKDSVKSQLRVIEKSSNKLLNLVNQILDLRRIQDKKLAVREINLSDFTTKICQDFQEMSIQNHIKLKVNTSSPNLNIWADPDSLDKILINLLSNAFKYCHKGDVIEVSVEESEKHVLLKVSDNGPGISPAIQKRLFVRFSNYNENPSNPSTGLGLSIVKDLAEKLGAEVLVDSTDGKGSSFQVAFLKGYQHFKGDVDVLLEENEAHFFDEITVENEEEILPHEEAKRENLVGLIVEDDPELQRFIVSILENDYTIYTAENGDEGYSKAEELLPDFIISDIMMPEKDGIEMLKLIRDNFSTSHIPVILLSAKSSIESKLEGLEYGADDYMTKPFNVSLLKAKVKNVLEQRIRLQQLFSSGNTIDISKEEPLKISNKDQKFMFQVIEFVKENMSNSDFSVDELGKLMCMSRASFFNKLKSITGVSPVVFIRDLRLSEAAELLKNDDLLIKEIGFEVGFNDLKYFGKCFRAKYNYTPAEYRRQFR
ncbi:hybrid sensor histidine kinase/response regulator transcription factor [Flavobacterium chungbukense]|uniref:hybrid sensor histidine kinase/response regulator transcription factor n=1 Tax=Flavobacterium chungbukense TaxID=877464 RepID=UPI001E63E01F|nr:hybrid sensor histidine kinase/response regulator transcription factor [Flavobacterium chungbukense]MCC4923973.1 response regulator [Flavobacterium chungbukense]